MSMKEKQLFKLTALLIALLMGLAMIVSCSKDDGDATPPENPYKDGYYPDQKVSSNPTAYGFVDMSERSYIELFDGKYYMDHTKGEGGYLYYLVSQEENYHIWVNYEYGVAFLIDPYEVGRYRQLKECDGSIKATEYKDLYRIYHFDNAKKYPNINPVIVPATIDATVVMHLDQDAEYPRTNNSGGSSYDNDYDDEYPEGAKACYSCKGTCICTACKGTGKGVGYSGDCVSCRGTGICRFCDGKGYYFPLNGGGSSSGGNSSGGSSSSDEFISIKAIKVLGVESSSGDWSYSGSTVSMYKKKRADGKWVLYSSGQNIIGTASVNSDRKRGTTNVSGYSYYVLTNVTLHSKTYYYFN